MGVIFSFLSAFESKMGGGDKPPDNIEAPQERYEEEWEAFVEKFKPAICQKIISIGGPSLLQHQEDILQEIRSRIWMNIRGKKFPPGVSRFTLLMRIADSEIKRYIRTLVHHQKGDDLAAQQESEREQWGEEREREREEAIEELEALLSQLPSREREVVRLKELKGFKHWEIARLFHMRLSSVRRVYSRAMKKVKKMKKLRKKS